MSEKNKTDLEVEKGVFVSKVEPYSVAGQRGLSSGIAIVKADKQEITKTGQIKNLVKDRQGEVVILQIKTKDRFGLVFLEIPKQ